MKYIIAFFLFGNSLFGQQLLDFKSLRYDEDYAASKFDSTATFFDKIKHIPLDNNQAFSLSLGGEFRVQYQYIKNENWGDVEDDKDGFLLNRTLFHADLKFKKQFRIFGQLQSSVAIGRIDPSPVDRNDLDIHQLFADFNFNQGKNKFTIRFGRQEMMYGSQRLVSVRERPNSRQAFDAGKIIFQNTNFKTDIFYSQYVRNQFGVFDDRLNPDTKFYGSYNVINDIPIVQNIDFYYFGLQRKNAEYDDAAGHEIRHSIGTRIWRKNYDWNYDVEVVYQFGSIEGKQIQAYTISVNTTYQLSTVKFKPIIGLKTEIISGDTSNGDDKIQTFNALFPKGAYFGIAALIGPSNLIDIHPSIELQLNDDLVFSADYDVFWRHSIHDGIYQTNSTLLYTGVGTSQRYIGSQLAAQFEYEVQKWLIVQLEGTWFDAQDYLKEVTPGKDIFYAGTSVTLRF